MRSGQFIRGKIDGIQKAFESPGIDKLLPEEKLNELRDITDIGEHPNFYRKGLALIKTIVSPADNTDGRRGGIINHTVFYVWDQKLKHEDVDYIFDLDTFVSQVLEGKRRFKMPPMPSLPSSNGGLISLPPPLEWEV